MKLEQVDSNYELKAAAFARPWASAAKAGQSVKHITIVQLVRSLINVITCDKGFAPSPKFLFVSYAASVPRLLWRKQACCSSRRYTVFAGPWPTRSMHCPASSSSLTKTSVALAVVSNVCAKGIFAKKIKSKRK